MREICCHSNCYSNHSIILIIVHTYRSSVQQQSINLPIHPTNESKCSADKSVETIECETDLHVDTGTDTVYIGTETIYESLPGLQQSFNTNPLPCSLLVKSECHEAKCTGSTVSNQVENIYNPIPGQ